MNNSLLFLFLFTTGCATRVYHSPPVEYKVTATYDPIEKSIHRDYSYSNGILLYKQMIDTKQINTDSQWSCYKDNVSTNYIEMKDKELKFFRSLHVDEDRTISYTKRDMHYKEKSEEYYYRYYSEEKVKDYIRVKSKKCLILKDKIRYYVTSEKYSIE